MRERRLIRTDRNGTKYYELIGCPKCGGTGNIPYYAHVDGGTCFKCCGTGDGISKYKEYTEEYKAKLEERRRKREEAKTVEKNKEFVKKLGLNEQGTAYMVLAQDTYTIKNELKQKGARYNNFIGWYFNEEKEGYETYPINLIAFYKKNQYGQYYGYINEQGELLNELVRTVKEAYLEQFSISEYVGELKQRITLQVKYEDNRSYETNFTYYGETTMIYMFDYEGNKLIWKTGSYIDAQIGDTITITGTIKEHKTYNGVKQTILTRCKVTK